MLKAAVWPGLRSPEEKDASEEGEKKKKNEEEKENTRSRGRAAGRKPTLPSAHSARGGGGSWARCTGRLQEARRHGWQSRDSNLDLHSIITFTSWTKEPEWRMAGLGTRVRCLGCGEGVLFGNYLGTPPDPASPSFLRPSSAATWTVPTDSRPLLECRRVGSCVLASKDLSFTISDGGGGK